MSSAKSSSISRSGRSCAPPSTGPPSSSAHRTKSPVGLPLTHAQLPPIVSFPCSGRRAIGQHTQKDSASSAVRQPVCRLPHRSVSHRALQKETQHSPQRSTNQTAHPIETPSLRSAEPPRTALPKKKPHPAPPQ